MAVFKPTNCSPYLTAFDITYLDDGPIYFQCKIDTSNTKIDGYSITIYNEENEQVFPSGNESGVNNISYIKDLLAETKKPNGLIKNDDLPDLNTGLNGSYLKIPFVVKAGTVVDSSIIKNMIFSSGNSVTDDMASIYGAVNGSTVYIENASVDNTTVNINKTIENSEHESISLENGKQYKWIITLYQLGDNTVEAEGQRPIDDKYYDMLISSGKVIGSTNERIQIYPTEEIYTDYFIQLYKIDEDKVTNGSVKVDILTDYQLNKNFSIYIDTNDPEPIGTRVRIKDYDSYLGHIYPQTGNDGFSKENIDNANLLKVFKMSNNPDDLGTTDKVDFCANKDCFIPKYFDESESNNSVSSLLQIFYVGINSTVATSPTQIIENVRLYYNNVFSLKEENGYYVYDPTKQIFSVVFGQSRIVLNTETSENDINKETGAIIGSPEQNDKASPYNGIWIPKDPSIDTDVKFTSKSGNVTTNYYRVKVSWYRSSDADTFGELVNKVVLDTNNAETDYDKFAGKNIQPFATDATGEQVQIGTINKTPIKFNEEEALEIYPDNSYAHDYAYINKTQLNKNRIFINPSTSVSVGDKIFDKNSKSFEIKTLNSTVWGVTTSDKKSNEYKIADAALNTGDPYKIKTFFRSSSENQFNLYKKPDISIELQSITGGSDPNKINEIYEVGERSFVAIGEYDQSNLIQWQSYQWFLYDGDYTSKGQFNNDDLILESPIGYDKEIKYEFYGLAETNHEYTIVLVLTDQYNTIITKRQLIKTTFQVEIDKSGKIESRLRCDLSAVDIQFFDKNGYILPELRDRNYLLNNNNYNDNPTGVEYYDEEMSISNNVDEGGVEYSHISSNVGIQKLNPPIKTDLSFEQDKGLQIYTTIRIDTDQYTAELINMDVEKDDETTDNLTVKFEDLYLSKEVTPDEIIGGFPNPNNYKFGNYIIYQAGSETISSHILDGSHYFNTTDLWPEYYSSYITNYRRLMSYLPCNIIPFGANKMNTSNTDNWYYIDYDLDKNIKTIISNKLIEIEESTDDYSKKQDVFYDFPIFSYQKKKNAGQLLVSDNTYTIWEDKNENIIIPTLFKDEWDQGSNDFKYYYSFRLVKNHNGAMKDYYWEDEDKDGNINYWEDEDYKAFKDVTHLRTAEKNFVTPRELLKDEDLIVDVKWSKNGYDYKIENYLLSKYK